MDTPIVNIRGDELFESAELAAAPSHERLRAELAALLPRATAQQTASTSRPRKQ